MSAILNKDGQPTSVLAEFKGGQVICRTTEELEQVFAKHPSCRLWYECTSKEGHKYFKLEGENNERRG